MLSPFLRLEFTNYETTHSATSLAEPIVKAQVPMYTAHCHFDDVAWFFTCNSFTTCFTFGTLRRDLFGHRALSLCVDLASQRDGGVFDSVLYAFVKFALYKGSVQVFLDPSVQICVHRLGIAFCARQNHGNLVRHNLSAGDGFRYGFSL